jgi:hypothetical protein
VSRAGPSVDIDAAGWQDDGMLDGAATSHFRRHGWVHLPRFLSERETADCRRWTEEIASWPETPGTWMRYYEKDPRDPTRGSRRC